VIRADVASRPVAQRFARERGESWAAAAPPHPVVLGRSGMAWGRGLHAQPAKAPRKREGDGKAPSGIFPFGTAFGYAAEPVPGSRWPYRQATETDFFVDDVDSRDYNQWIRLRMPQRDPGQRWKSFERMRRADLLYRHGLVVQHNTTPAIPGSGSAIFLHIWRGPGQPTAGCTAMAEADLIRLLKWLRPLHHPLLVQIPQSAAATLRLNR
jgi:L,D-peptidoglycan transpeptidase YkuD (ErfK/YbiS/YcfS/YnhG family)